VLRSGQSVWVSELRMEDFPKCENCGGPVVPDDIGPIWIVTVAKEGYPQTRTEDGRCVVCARPLWPHPYDDDLVIEVPDSGDYIVLLRAPNAHAAYPEGNLVRVGARGRELWRVRPGAAHDSWVEVTLREGELHARSWQSWLVRFDLDGHELGREFTK
jgi:hypothetical protein